jgi:hypothetical protein
MRNLFTKLKEGLFPSFDSVVWEPASIRIIKLRSIIRKEILMSRDSGKVLGVYCPVLGDGMFLTCVDDVVNGDGQEIVVFKPYDMNGHLLQRNQLAIAEIRSVCPFDSYYVNPLIKEEKEFVFRQFQSV